MLVTVDEHLVVPHDDARAAGGDADSGVAGARRRGALLHGDISKGKRLGPHLLA